MARCFVTRELPGDALTRLEGAHETEVWHGDGPPPPDVLRERAADAEGLLSLLTDPIDAELIAAAPALQAISNYAVGVDNIDVEAATERRIPVGHTPDVLTDSTADLAIGLMLAIARRIPEGERTVREGGWSTWTPALAPRPRSARGHRRARRRRSDRRAVAHRLEGFGCEVLVAGREGPMLFSELLTRSDFVSLHVPLNPGTRGLIGAPELAAMKETAYLINTARGPIVDQGALAEALAAGQIAGAALDVTDPEPLPADDPLLDAPNVLVIPHLGSATERTRSAMASRAVDNLLAGLAGERMPSCVNAEVYGS